ncbi:unknown [Clostridium sp. CAG:628]|nr:unknown [Clostridium sp. CAG:628]
MELVDDKLFEYSLDANKFRSLIVQSYKENKGSFKEYISYDEFRLLIKNLIFDIMKYYLDRINVVNCHGPYVRVFHFEHSGRWVSKYNEITINEDVVRNIYEGNMRDMISIFHELVHFQMFYDINYRKLVNEDTIRIVKEELIEDYIRENNLRSNNSYYKDNYVYLSSEIYAEKEGINLLVEFLYLVYKSVIGSKKDLYDKMYVIEEEIRKDTPDYEKRYKKKLRYFREIKEFPDKWVSYEEVFDYLVKFNSEWLEYPQISAQYDIVNGIVNKKDTNIEENVLKLMIK